MKPAPADVRAYRERIQARFNLGITQAQDWCEFRNRRVLRAMESGGAERKSAGWVQLLA